MFCLSSSSWVVVTSLPLVVLVFELNLLAACLCVTVSVLSFCAEPCGGLVGRANREGSIYFLPFFIIGCVWAKTRTSLGEEGFFARFWL